MIKYICKYTPLELIRAMGLRAEMPNEEVQDFGQADALIHPSICSHAKQLLSSFLSSGACEEGCGECHTDGLILTNCCDSIRRVGDICELDGELRGRFSVRKMLDLPQDGSPASVSHYEEELERLLSAFSSGAESHGGVPETAGNSQQAERQAQPSIAGFDRKILISEWKKSAEFWKACLRDPSPAIGLLGARAGDGLIAMLESCMPIRVMDLTCGGLRSLPEMPLGIEEADDRTLLQAYAKALLSQLPCMRMKDVSRRKELYRENFRGMIYHTVRFCDFYAFEYAELMKEAKVPVLKLESDYTDQNSGQLSTRLEAFLESLESRKSLKKPMHEEDPAYRTETGQNAVRNTEETERGMTDREKRYYIGIDSGSTTTNAAALDQTGRVIASKIIRTGVSAAQAAEKALSQVLEELQADRSEIAYICATGYGRDFIPFADGSRTEISCHAKGAYFNHPSVRTIIDIGGQDSKVICLDDSGKVLNFIMNDKCAAGTGRFLEMMASTLQMYLSEMSQVGLEWKQDLTISSVCTVFAESEVVSLVAQNKDIQDIVHALNKAVASRVVSMARRAKSTGPYMMTGGVARNAGVRGEIERMLGEKLYVPEMPDLTGAAGAALFAMEITQA